MGLPMMVGVHEKGTFSETWAAYPGHEWARNFVAWSKGNPVIPASATAAQIIDRIDGQSAADLAAGGSAMVSFKIDPAEVLAKKWGDKLAEVGRWTAGRRIVLVYWHEPEDDHQGKTFAPAFNMVRAALKNGNPDLLVGWAAMAYQWYSTRGYTNDVGAWQQIIADLYLLDAYSGQSFRADCILPEHPGFVRWYNTIIAPYPGRVWGVAERGITAGESRAATWKRELEWLLTDPVGQQCAAYIVWNTGGTEGNAAWLIDGDPATQAVVRELVSTLSRPPAVPAGPPAGFSVVPAGAEVLLHEETGAIVSAAHVEQWRGFVGLVAHAAGGQ